MDAKMIKNRNSQITIFVIIALIIVVGIALVFALMKGGGFGISAAENPQASISQCTEEAVEEAIEQIMPHGGYIETKEPYLVFDDEKVAFLCYTEENRKICTNTEPMLIEKIEEEIQNYIKPKVEGCFSSLAKDLGGFDYKAGQTAMNVEIKPGNIVIKIDKQVSYTKSGQTLEITAFDTILSEPTYYFAGITNNIINEEVNCNCGEEICNADVFSVAKTSTGANNFEVERFVTGRNEKIYTIREIASGKEFKFAVRNCVRLP